MTTRPSRRLALQQIATAAMALGPAPRAWAQTDWPKAGPVKLVVPFTAGSGTDVLARILAEKLGSALGQQFVVDNKPGAGGTLGAAMVLMSWSRMAKSASLPTSSEPRRASSKANQALPRVYRRSASSRLGISAATRCGFPLTVLPSSSHCSTWKGL